MDEHEPEYALEQGAAAVSYHEHHLRVRSRRVVPPDSGGAPAGWGRRRAGDGEALAAITFVATSGCTWRRFPSLRAQA
ncbi:hypothetical protein [Streptomyces sp. NPDC006307]|uniref:hypothetical protein n=1 Tax=Streptomyces sp. NPDC006307 TaxID=3156748 RepID=UPI0033B90CFA